MIRAFCRSSVCENFNSIIEQCFFDPHKGSFRRKQQPSRRSSFSEHEISNFFFFSRAFVAIQNPYPMESGWSRSTKPVLRIRIRDPVPFWPLNPGWVKRSGSGMNILDHISEILETIFWVKILKFFDANADSDSGFFLTLDPRSGMEKISFFLSFFLLKAR